MNSLNNELHSRYPYIHIKVVEAELKNFDSMDKDRWITHIFGESLNNYFNNNKGISLQDVKYDIDIFMQEKNLENLVNLYNHFYFFVKNKYYNEFDKFGNNEKYDIDKYNRNYNQKFFTRRITDDDKIKVNENRYNDPIVVPDYDTLYDNVKNNIIYITFSKAMTGDYIDDNSMMSDVTNTIKTKYKINDDELNEIIKSVREIVKFFDKYENNNNNNNDIPTDEAMEIANYIETLNKKTNTDQSGGKSLKRFLTKKRKIKTNKGRKKRKTKTNKGWKSKNKTKKQKKLKKRKNKTKKY